MKKNALLFLFTVVAISAFSQGFNKAFQNKTIQTDSSFTSLASVINKFYDTATASNKSGYKQWKRWEWFAAHHQNTDGKLDNYILKNMEAIVAEEKIKASSITQQSYNGNWQSIGHSNTGNATSTALQGRVNCIAFDPVNSQIMYAGAAGGGIWKTTDGGESWFNVTATLPALGISDLLVAPWPDNNTIYALTGEGLTVNIYPHKGFGCIKSTDGGNTWQMANKGMFNATPAENFGGYKLLQHPNEPNTIFAATSNGLFTTIDGANNWQQLFTGVHVMDIELKPDDPNLLYYTLRGNANLFTYNISSETFSSTPVTAAANRMEIGVSANSPDAIYVLAGPGSVSGTNNIFTGLFYRANTSVPFTRKANSINNNVALMNAGALDIGFYANTIYVNPGNADDVFIGSISLARSTNGGTSFNQVANNNIHADQHALVRHPITGHLWLCNDGGIYTSTDGGNTFFTKSNGLVITEIYRYSGQPGVANKHLIGTQDNGHFLYNSNTNPQWTFVMGGDGMDNLISSVNPDIMYACIQNGGLRRSVNNGASFLQVPNIPDYNNMNVYPWITPIVQHPPQPQPLPFPPVNEETIYMYSNNGVLVIVNNGQTVYNIGPNALPAAVGITPSLAVANINNGANAILYLCNGHRMWVNENPLQNVKTNWTEIFVPGTVNENIAAIAINPANPQDISIALAGYINGSKVFRSINRGSTWVNMSNGLPNVPMYSLIYANAANSNIPSLYVGSEIGVYYFNIQLLGWVPFSNHLPRVPVTDLQIDLTNNQLTAATYGRGLWKSDLYEPCPDTRNVDVTITGGQLHFESSNQTNTTATITGGINTMVTLRAANRVVFKSGFSATGGAYLKAVNGPCASGPVLPFVPVPANQE